MTHETPSGFSSLLVVRACMLAIQWSRLPWRALQTFTVVSQGLPSSSNFGSTVAPSPLHCSGHPDVSGHSISAASLLIAANFPVPNSSQMWPFGRKRPHSQSSLTHPLSAAELASRVHIHCSERTDWTRLWWSKWGSSSACTNEPSGEDLCYRCVRLILKRYWKVIMRFWLGDLEWRATSVCGVLWILACLPLVVASFIWVSAFAALSCILLCTSPSHRHLGWFWLGLS